MRLPELAEAGSELAALGPRARSWRCCSSPARSGAVGDGVAVVLLVAAAGVLIWPARVTARLAAELLAGVAAGDVEAVGELALEPVVVRLSA